MIQENNQKLPRKQLSSIPQTLLSCLVASPSKLLDNQFLTKEPHHILIIRKSFVFLYLSNTHLQCVLKKYYFTYYIEILQHTHTDEITWELGVNQLYNLIKSREDTFMYKADKGNLVEEIICNQGLCRASKSNLFKKKVMQGWKVEMQVRVRS